MSSVKFHAVFFSAWLTVALLVAVKTALLGNLQSGYAKQRGGDLKQRTDLHYQHERLRAVVDWQTSPSVLAETVRRLDLPLYPLGQAPLVTAPAARSGASATQAAYASLERRRP